jgi:hypothetical protein
MTLQCLEIAYAAGFSGKRRSGREILFYCPCHDNQHPSLSINPDKNCWFCDPCGKSGSAWEMAAFLGEIDPHRKTAVLSWLNQHGLQNGKDHWALVCEYAYGDKNNNRLFRVKRFKTKHGNTLIQERAAGNGNWIGGNRCMHGVRLVRYRLSEWINTSNVCIVEGKKDADRLWALDIPATCNLGGAGRWRRSSIRYSQVKMFPYFRTTIIQVSECHRGCPQPAFRRQSGENRALAQSSAQGGHIM